MRPERHVTRKEAFGLDAQIGALTVPDLVFGVVDAIDEDRQAHALPDRVACADAFAFRDALDRRFDDTGEEA